MARQDLKLPTNVDGDFFVDESCIDCDACRLIAPAVFARRGERSAVHHQPITNDERLAAQQALLSCPTSSIGDVAKRPLARAIESLPSPITDDIFFCGYTAESSFGAISYLIVRPSGNVLVDSPRFNKPLVRNIERLGGVSSMLLTHRDDVADHAKFREHFGCERWMHRDDVTRGTTGMEHQPGGRDPVRLDDDLVMIPVPGHTRGHVVYLFRDEVLFSGDHLAWNVKTNRLYAFRNACWYSWSEQIHSMERLLDFQFARVLPGHGRPIDLPKPKMHVELERCVEWMRRAA